MPEIRMRPKNQVTLPAGIVRAANLQPDDKLSVDFINGKIIITPHTSEPAKDDVLSYAGIFSGAWGETAEKVDQTLRNLHDEWNN